MGPPEKRLTDAEIDELYGLEPAIDSLPGEVDPASRPAFVIVACPYCGAQHRHGGGPLRKDPRRLLSHRAQHCMAGPEWPLNGYVLVDAAPDRTALVIGHHRTSGAALRWDR